MELTANSDEMLRMQRRLHRAQYTSQAWREGFLGRRT